MNLTDLESYVQVVELGTIAAAASSAGVPRSTITRRIVRLENQLGTALLRRSARSFSVTDDGKLLHRLCIGAIRELKAAEQSLAAATATPHGRLVVSAPDFGRSGIFADLMVAYRRRYPDVRVELRLDNRVVDLIHEGVDVAVRAHVRTIPGDADLMARVFEMAPMGLYASPTYLSHRGAPERPETLLEHDLVLHSAGVGVPKRLFRAGEEIQLDLGEPSLQANDTQMALMLVSAGAGIGLLPGFVAHGAVSRGDVVRVLPSWSMRAGRIAIVWPSNRHLAPRVRAFVDLARDVLGTPLESLETP